MKRISILLTVLLLISSCTQGDVEESEIKIGFISAQTGSAALYGVPALRSAQFAVDNINKEGGVLGKKLKLVVEDGQCNGKMASTAAQKLIQNDNLSIILGGHCSTESMVIAPIASENEVFMLAQITSTPDFPHIPYVYRTSPSSSLYMAKTADVAYQKGYRKMATFVEQLDFPLGVAKDFKERFEELGGEIVSMETFAPGNSDFRTELTKLKSLDVDALLVESQAPDSAAIIMKQIKELDIDKPLVGGPMLISDGTYGESGGLLPENAFTVTIYADKESPRMKPFVKHMMDNYGGYGFTLFYIAGVYDNVFLLKEAIESCGEVDSSCLDQYMSNLEEFDGITGRYRFTNGRNPKVTLVTKYIRGGESVFEPID